MWKLIVILLFFTGSHPLAPAVQAPAHMEVLNRNGEPSQSITDGDLVQIRLRLDSPAAQDSPVAFRLGRSNTQVAACTISSGASECTTPLMNAFGWYWIEGSNPAGDESILTASVLNQALDVSLSLRVNPRPAVLVHGFVSDYRAWQPYLGPQGYLASAGIPGFAVGDGQVEGTMNTGSLDQPASTTNTISQNATILADYIEQVKEQTGAQVVDLIGHSMGGLISRFYIDRLMQERDVAQLIMLGTPSAGTDCAILPSSLGFYYPTVLEIRSSYMVDVFNQQIRQRHNVPFFALAGTRVTSPVGSPCTSVPNDLVVSVDSVNSINLDHQEKPVLHIDLNISGDVFNDFVLPLLQRLPSDTWVQPDPPISSPVSSPLQFTRVFTGHVDPGSSDEQTIILEAGLTVASFALYDPSLSLEVQVTGASGQVVELTADQHGLIQVDNPATLVMMGYGFANPRPGTWKIKLTATGKTPAAGADYALTAHLSGGAELSASADPLLPSVHSPVHINASLQLAGSPLDIQAAEAFIRGPGGFSTSIPLSIQNNQAQTDWQPGEPGFYAVDVFVSALLEDGTEIERTAYLSIESHAELQALPQQFSGTRLVLILAVVGILVIGLGILVFAFRRIKKKSQGC